MAINIGGGYHSKDKQGRPRSGEKVDELLDKIEDAKIENGTISIGGRSITPITEHQDISGKANVGDSYTKSESDNKYSTKQELNGKQDVINDLQAIRSGAGAGATAYQKPEDGIPAEDIKAGVIPDVPTNVSAFTNDAGYLTEHQSLDDYYTKTQVDTALDAKADTADLADVATSGDYNDLSNKPTIPAAQVNSDWNATGGVAEILNKPTIPAEQIQADWEQDDSSAKDYIKNKPNYAGSQSAGGPANKAVSIPFGQVDSTSTSTAFTATVDGITELRDGVCVYLRNGVVTSASGYTININNLGAKRVYQTMSAASASTTQFDKNYTMLFVYNSSRVAGGCWDMFYGYNTNDNYIGYDIRDYRVNRIVKSILYSYRLLFTCMDGSLLPVNTDNGTTAATHILTKDSFNPWGQIYFYNSAATVSANSRPATATLISQSTYGTPPDFRYSFNTGTMLVANNDIYIKCIPRPDGSAILADDAIVFALPTYEDGFIYKRLGKAYDTYRIILEQDKPVYYYKDGIKLWTGYNLQEGVMVTDEFTKKDSNVTSDVRVKSVGGKTVVWNQILDYLRADISQGGIYANYDSDTGVYTLGGTSTGGTNLSFVKSRYTVKQGHKYLFNLGEATSNKHAYIVVRDSDLGVNYIQVDLSESYQKYQIVSPSRDYNVNYYLNAGNSDFTIAGTVAPRVYDLTQMFGTGNEPSTVEEFEAMFPEDSYAYDAGRIVNVAMTGMKSLDADGNDLDSAELDVTTLTGVAEGGSTSETIFPNGMNGIGDVRDEIDLVTGAKYEQLEYLETDGACAIATDLLLDGSEEWEIKFQSSKNTLSNSLAGSFNGSSSYTGRNVYIVANNIMNNVNSYSVYCDGQTTSAYYCWNGGNCADKLPHIIKYYGNVNTAPSIDGITMSPLTSKTHTAVTPSIPWMLFGRVGSSITDIGYTTDGVRIFYFKGDGFNYIPCRRVSDGMLGFFDTVSEKFYTNVGTGTFRYGSIIGTVSSTKARAIKRIGVVDMGDLGWHYNATHNGLNVQLSDKKTGSLKIISRPLTALNTSFAWSNIGNIPDKTISGSNDSNYVFVKDSTYSDATTFTTAMSGELLYYELETPIEYTLDTTPSCAISVVKGGKEMILPYNASEPQCAPVRIVEEYKEAEQVQADWNQTDSTARDYIKNKPVISNAIDAATITSAATMTIAADVVTVIDGDVGTAAITLQVPSDNKAHVWDILMTTGATPAVTLAMSNGETILAPSGFSIGASKAVEISVIGVGTVYYLRYGEFA